ncbi:MAG TPA: serine/threonine-protein kinase [Polyangiaceae bacterium]|jgi:serine/threonine-protein kinase
MLEPGQIIQDKYRIVRLIGQGGMGEVYEGENISIARRVAIKVLLSYAATSADTVQRFEREAQAAGRIGNDHILEVLDLGTLPTGDRFMVMEYLDGEPLNGRIERLRRMTPQQIIPIITQALAGLSAAHAAGIIHRDLKPENLFVLKQKAGVPDYVKIIDFGISKFNTLTSEGMKMTRTGSVMGTPYYMSPEQANGSAEADNRSDLYAMGVILYEAVTGAVPFDGKTFNELLFKIVLSEPPPPRRLVPEMDPVFEAIVLKAMARDVTARFQSCEEFSQALSGYLAGHAPAFRQTPGHPVPFSNSGAQLDKGSGSSWSKTDGQIPKQSNAGLFAVLAVVGLLMIGGGAFAAMKLRHGSEPAVASGAPAADKAPALNTVAAAAAIPAPPEPTAAAVAPAPAEPASAAASATAVANVPHPAQLSSSPASKPAAGHPAAGKPAAAAPKKSGAKASAGTDFGY